MSVYIDDRLRESIAISGMSCRLPGGVNSPKEFWELMVEGRSGQGTIPTSRFQPEAFHHDDPEHLGTINGTGGYFLSHDVKSFDNNFFGIHNLEAKYMDPQQRQLLEVVYECLEDAGEGLGSISGTNVGCFVGNFTFDYPIIQAHDPEVLHRYSATGFGPTILANRISHFFNLKGPSFVLDTACSSSLYALYMACSALNAGDCDAAIVAGANLVQSPEVFIAMTKAGVLSATSTSHTFDSSADGYGRGEGVAALYLKKLSTAVTNHDPIRSIIRATAVNSNGHTAGITLPGLAGQEAVIRKAYETAGLKMNDTTYVEAHGTGTPVGDPIEVNALSNAFDTTSRETLLIGSNKPNVGHGEAISGLTSIIKATLALQHGIIPPTIGVRQLNPELRLIERNIEIVQKLTPWPVGRTERISVNAFGYGGANAHAILDSAAMHITAPEALDEALEIRSVLLPFSAHCAESLDRNMEAVAELQLSPIDLCDLAFTLCKRRSRLPYRNYSIGTVTKSGVQVQRNRTSIGFSSSSPGIAFVFTGQGTQWPGMGQQLLRRFPVYRAVIDNLDEHLRSLLNAPSWTIMETILQGSDNESIYKADRSQTVCTAIQIGLVELLKSWGVQCSAAIGHSSGEIAAAFASGHISSHEALAIAYFRGYTSAKILAKGAMLAIGAGFEQTTHLIHELGVQDAVRVACINSPKSTTISGGLAQVDKVLQALQQRNIFSRKLRTDDKAYHSHLMQLVGQEYEELLTGAMSGHPFSSDIDIKMFSSVTVELASRAQVRNPAYWRMNLESPVMFHAALELLLSDSKYHLIEMGPHPALGQPIKDIFASTSALNVDYSYTLHRGRSDDLCMLQLAGILFSRGNLLSCSIVNELNNQLTSWPGQLDHLGGPESGNLKINDLYLETSGSRLNSRQSYRSKVFQKLPPYSWNHQAPLWTESRTSAEYRKNRYKRHDLLGSRATGTPGHLFIWRNQLTASQVPWIRDHKLGTSVVFPAAGYISMAIEALLQVSEKCQRGSIRIRNMHLTNMLVLPNNEKDLTEISTVLESFQTSQTTSSDIWWKFQISTFKSDHTNIHAKGFIAVQPKSTLQTLFPASPTESMEKQAIRTFYNRLGSQGLSFGPAFQSLKTLYTDRHRKHPYATSVVEFRNGGGVGKTKESDYLIHPITIDSLLQSAIVASCEGISNNLHGKVPVEVASAEILLENLPASSSLCSVRAHATSVGIDATILEGEIQDGSDRIIARLENVRAVNYRETSLAAKSTLERDPALSILWKPDISMAGEPSCLLRDYSDKFIRNMPDGFARGKNAYLVSIVDLLLHKDGRMNILELGEEKDTGFVELFNMFSFSRAPRRYRSYTRGMLDDDGRLHLHNTHKLDDVYDLMIATSMTYMPASMAEGLTRYLSEAGVLLYCGTENIDSNLSDDISRTIFRMPDGSAESIILARKIKSPGRSPRWNGPIILIHDDESKCFIDPLSNRIKDTFGVELQTLSVTHLGTSDIPPNSIVVSTLEFSNPFLSTMNERQQAHINILTENAAILLWITAGGLAVSRNPEAAIVLGLARSLMLERPSFKMPVLDVDYSSVDFSTISHNIISILSEALTKTNPDLEFRDKNGTLYISRFVPDVAKNSAFRRKQDADSVQMKISDVGYATLGLKAVGQVNTLRFEQKMTPPKLKSGFVRVQIEVVGINAKDLYALSDKVNIKNSTLGLDFSGIVVSTGSPESMFASGDRVVVMAPHRWGTTEDVPEWACCRLKANESPAVMATIPIVFSTALYALEQRARLERGQSVLIQSGAGGLGIAAIQVARMLGAEIFTTVGTKEKRAFLMDRFGIADDHIFDSHNASFAQDLLHATSGRGVDVILNSLTGDLLHESWETLAPFGTFVEVGKRDIADSGRLHMRIFERATTFTAFDLTELFWSTSPAKQQTWARLLQRSVNLLRRGQLQPITPLKVFPASEIDQAFRYFASAKRVGKVVVSFDKGQSIPVVPLKYNTRLSPRKSYILVGCLGGLGRSLSRWMLEQGARYFTFIGRSGTDKASAATLVKDLEALGAVVTVCRGSVTDPNVVAMAIDSSEAPIGGVIQASMAIHVSLFKDMNNWTWHAGLDQKIQGTWNLHYALQGQDSHLDFFLMLSSITGSVGTATESNYCAANSFLDAFGSYRRSLGLPAVAVGLGMISEVGFLHENPDTETVLLRKGVHPFTEAEFLQIIDLSLTEHDVDTSAAIDDAFGLEYNMRGHILTGLELHGFQKIRDQGYVRGAKVLEDPRCTYIAGAFAENPDSPEGGGLDSDTSDVGSKLPRSVKIALAESSNRNEPSEDLCKSIQAIVVKYISSLLLVSVDSFQGDTLLSEFGMESMLAAELRSDIFRVLNVDIPFTLLLDQRTKITTIVEAIGFSLI